MLTNTQGGALRAFYFRRWYPWLRSAPPLLLAAGIIGLMGWQFWLGYHYDSNDTTNLYLRLARGSAYLLLVVFVLLWLPVLRRIATGWSQSVARVLLPAQRLKQVHKWLGYTMLVTACVHGSQYLLYYTTLNEPFNAVLLGEEPDLVRAMRTNMYEFVAEDEAIDDVVNWLAMGASPVVFENTIQPILKADCTKCHSRSSTMTYAIPSMPLGSYDEVMALSGKGMLSRQFRINMSGLAMIVLVVLLAVYSLHTVRQRAYHRFQSVHQWGYLLAALALLHIPQIEWLALPTLLLLVDLYWRRRNQWSYQPAVLEPLEGFVRLNLNKPVGFDEKAGHYVRIRIPDIDQYEWHAFSVTCLEDERLVLKIRVLGDWTQALYRLSQEGKASVDLQGPFASPVVDALRRQDRLFIAGGVGITPFLGLLRQYLLKPDQGRVCLVWVVRHAWQVQWLQSLLALSAHAHVEYRIFLTQSADLKPVDGVTLQQGRPDWNQLFADLSQQGMQPACYVCGPKAMQRVVNKVAKAQGWPVTAEQF